MFISFFTGKVMLFYGITLIMKEKSNASALPSYYFLANALLRSIASRPAFDCISSRVRSCLVPRSPKSIGTETGKTLLLLTSAVVALLLKGRCVQNPEKTLRGFGPNSMAVRRSANIRRRSEAKHCSSLCSQSEGHEYCGGQTRLKIQQSHAPKR